VWNVQEEQHKATKLTLFFTEPWQPLQGSVAPTGLSKINFQRGAPTGKKLNGPAALIAGTPPGYINYTQFCKNVFHH
jgi:hypothetical protein